MFLQLRQNLQYTQLKQTPMRSVPKLQSVKLSNLSTIPFHIVQQPHKYFQGNRISFTYIFYCWECCTVESNLGNY